MGLIRRSGQSEIDFRNIYRYVAANNKSAAEKLLLDFQRNLSERPDLGKTVRSFPVGKYLFVYRPIEGGIELLRVIHGARKVKRVFRRGEM